MKKLLLILVALAFIAGFVSAQEIAVIVKTGNSSFWQNVQTGCFNAQKELKAMTPKLSVTFLGPQSESNVNEEINIVESAIDRGVKAIILAPSDVTALIPAVKKAKDAGIPVVIIDSLLTGDPSNYVSFGPNNRTTDGLVGFNWTKGPVTYRFCYSLGLYANPTGTQHLFVPGVTVALTRNSEFYLEYARQEVRHSGTESFTTLENGIQLLLHWHF